MSGLGAWQVRCTWCSVVDGEGSSGSVWFWLVMRQKCHLRVGASVFSYFLRDVVFDGRW